MTNVSRWLGELFNVKVVDRYLEPIPHDIVIVVGSAALWCPWHDILTEVIKHSKRVIWVLQDYSVDVPTEVVNTQKELECWSILKHNPYPNRKSFSTLNFKHLINWNLIVWSPQEFVPHTESGLVYFGSFRKNRIDMFEKYLTGPYTVNICCSARNVAKFAEIGEFQHWPIMRDCAKELQKFQASVYIEDKFCRDKQYSPMNRFYECLSAGIPLWIDAACTCNLQQYPIQKNWIVDSAEDINWGADIASEQARILRPLIQEEYDGLAAKVKALI